MASKADFGYTSPAELKVAYETLHATFASGKTKNLAWRKWQLKQIWWLVVENEVAIHQALKADLHREEFESIVSEMTSMKKCIVEHINKLEKWAKDIIPDVSESLLLADLER